MQPKVSKEGQAAANRLREFRQNVDNGATSKEARAIVAQVEGKPLSVRQQNTLNNMPNQALVPTPAKEAVSSARQARNNTTITADAMKPEPAFNLTPPAPAVQGAALEGAIQAETDAFTQNLEAQKQATETKKGTALEEYIKGIQNRQGIEGFTTQLEDQMGFAGIEGELNDINQQIREEQLAMRRATERVLAQGGQSKGQAQTMINNLERDSLARQADLSIIQLGKQAKYDSAIARIDRKAKALFEQEQNVLDALKFNYSENKDLFTTAEQRLFETKLGDRQRKIQEEIDNRKAIDNFALQALQAGASVAEARQAMQAKTLDEAMGLVGSYFRPKPAAVASGFKAPEIKEINGVDYQWNSQTGQWEPVSISGGVADPQAQQINETLSIARDLLSPASVGKGSAVGASLAKFVPFGQSLGLQGNRTAFENKVNTLKANLTLDNLSLLKGPMSDKDLAFLQSVGSSLTTDMSEKSFDTELRKVIKKLETAQGKAPVQIQAPLAQGVDTRLYTGNIQLAPDGTQVEIID